MSEAHEIVTGAGVEAKAVETKAEPKPEVKKEDVLARIEAAASELRSIIVQVKSLPRDKSLAPHVDELRCLGQAQNNLQAGFMWLRRSANPTKEF